MKILYDHQIFSSQKYGGISRYFAQIVHNFPATAETEIAAEYSDNAYIQDLRLQNFLNISPIRPFPVKSDFRGKTRILHYLNKKKSIESLKRQGFDIFHPTYYDDYFLDYLGKKPFVLTIHDMIHELYPEMQRNPGLVKSKAVLAAKAAHIIAVSENTKRDIVDILNINPSKISVVYHGSSILKREKSKNLDLPEDYILYVGDRQNYKNFYFFISAIAPIFETRPTLKLLCTGRAFTGEELCYIKMNKLQERIVHMFVREKDFFGVFHQAKIFVFPSYYEGFGIPIIEAFDSECPVMLSNSSCFPEIAGDAAIYFNPKNVRQIRETLTELMDNKVLHDELISKGKKRAENFTWSNASEQTLEIYTKVLSL